MPRWRWLALLLLFILVFLFIYSQLDVRTASPGSCGSLVPHAPKDCPVRSPRNISLFIFGDSVDRYMTLEWCSSSNRRFCGPAVKDPSCNDVHAFARSIGGGLQFSVYSCTDENAGIRLLTITSVFGVSGASPQCRGPKVEPWNDPDKGWAKVFARTFLHMGFLWKPDAVLVQSFYWDLKRMKDWYVPVSRRCSSSDQRD